jgi:NAD(P)-dependent dehydrogenase (short-subunit alcohol dehydrogenase family)
MAGLMKDKIVLVTGGARGQGREMALLSAREGAAGIFLADILGERANETAREIEALGVAAVGHHFDVRDIAQVRLMVAAAHQKFGRIDVVFNNAGVLQIQELWDTTEDDWDYIIDTNLKGAYFVLQEVAKVMKTQNGGSIVSTASVSGRQAEPKAAPYGISKSGLIHLTWSAAVALAPWNIRVNSICPGMTMTDMWTVSITGRAAIEGVDIEEMTRRRFAMLPLGKPNEATDTAKLAVWLASDEARMMTGTNAHIDGGWVMR